MASEKSQYHKLKEKSTPQSSRLTASEHRHRHAAQDAKGPFRKVYELIKGKHLLSLHCDLKSRG